MKNYNKDICVLALLMLLGAGSCALAYENVTVNDDTTVNETQEKIRANKGTLEKAQSAINDKDFKSALNYLNSYIMAKQGKYEAYKLRGDAYYAIRRYDLAQRDYQTAVDIKSSEDKLSTNTKYVSAIILGADKNEQLQNVELGNLYAALMYAQKALNNPAYTISYDNAVKYNSHIYLPPQNKADINKINCPQKYARQLNPTGIDATIASAISDIEKGDFHSSVFKIQNVISEYPNYYLGYYLMGVSLVGLEKDEDAAKSFEKALSLNPYDFESLASLGQIYFDRAETSFSNEDSQKSVEYFLKALELNKNCPTYHFYLGLNNLNSGNISSAIRNFDHALKINENDYNSMYYKAIAQYINGDYNAVVNVTSKLLYKHVSNYNSVLYLRALAYNKLGQNDKALADLNSLDENIVDVFNTDIKVTSNKDKVLESYANYLRSQISAGQNNFSRNDNGTSNPIIKKLASVQNSLKPYESIINSKNITEADYTKLENFYSSSLPKLLETGLVVNYDDIDNQYDFIRTTFSDLGVSFIQKTPDTYVFTTIKDYYKRYYPKTLGENTLSPATFTGYESIPIQSVSTAVEVQNVPTDKILQQGETSLAQMLASEVLMKVSEERVKAGANTTPPPTSSMTSSDISNIEIKPQQIQDKTRSESIVSSQEPYVPSTKQLVDENNLKKVKDILEEEKNITDKNGSVVFSAKEIKPAQEFKIYNEPIKTPEVKNNTEISQDGNIKISAKEIKESSDFVVKHVPVSEEIVKPQENIVTKALLTSEKQMTTTTVNRPKFEEKSYIKPVYQGLSSAAAEAKIENSNDVVELEIPQNYPSLISNNNDIKVADRLGFGVATDSVDSIFDTTVVKNPRKSAEEKTAEIAENIEKIEEKISQTQEKADEIKEKASFENAAQDLKTLSQESVADVVVPEIDNADNIPAIRENLKDSIVTEKEDSNTAVKAVKDEKSTTSLLEEYEKLMKEKERLEKIQKKEELKLAKAKANELKQKAKEEKKQALEQAKAVKQAAKEEQKQALAQAKAVESAAKEEQKQALEQAKAAKLAAKEEQKQALEQAKAVESAAKEEQKQALEQAKAAKLAAKEEQRQALEQAKAAKQAAKEEQKAAQKELKKKASQEKATMQQEIKLAKEQTEALEAKKETNSTEPKEGFISKLKNKFGKTQQDKQARINEKAEKKAQALKLKEERAKAELEAKQRKMQQKANEKAISEQNKIQNQKDKSESFMSKLKNKFKKEEKTQDKVKPVSTKTEQKVKEKSQQKSKDIKNKPGKDKQKETKKSGTNQFIKKLKFWEKEKPQTRNSFGKYIDKAVKTNKPSIRL